MQSCMPRFFGMVGSVKKFGHQVLIRKTFVSDDLIGSFLQFGVHGIEGLVATIEIDFMDSWIWKIFAQIVDKRIRNQAIFKGKCSNPMS